MRVDEKTLKELEFDHVLKVLKEEAFSDYGRNYFKEFRAVDDIEGTFSKVIYVMNKIESISNTFYRIQSVREHLKDALEGKPLGYEKLKTFFDFFEVFENLKKEMAPNSPFSFFNIDPFFRKFVQEFSKTFSPTGKIKDNATPRLSKLRKEIDKLEKSANEKLKRLLFEGITKGYVSESLILQRHERYVLPVLSSRRTAVRGIVHGQSSTSSTLYIEPEELIDLNDSVALKRSQEKIEISRILSELTKNLIDNSQRIAFLVDKMEEFDGICARANYALKHDCIVPQISQDGTLKVIRGRNPLIPDDKIVPVDFEISSSDRVIVISGPNTGGKTATLKMIGIFSLMMAMGVPIPTANGTVLPVFNEVISDIGDDQSVKNELSTFSAKVKREDYICSRAKENTLILIDEMGDGTEPSEGAAFAMSVLDILIKKGAKAVVTTHLPDLKSLAFSTSGVRNASVGFNVEEMSPTYKIYMDMPGRSHAFEIIKRLGVSEKLIENFQRYRKVTFSKSDLLVEELQKEIQSYEDKLEKLEEKEKRLNSLEREVNKKIEILKRKKIENIDEDMRKISEEMKNVLKEIERAIHLLKSGGTLRDLREEAKKLVNLKKTLEIPQMEKSTKHPIHPKLGSYVTIMESGVTGRVLEIKNGKAIIDVDGLNVKVKVEDLKVVDERKNEEAERVEVHYVASQDVPREIDIRGMTIEEAIPLVEDFSDRVLKFKTVGYIIHGKGTGKLANGVWAFLRSKKIPFRLGKNNEGGSGVTVIGGEET